MNVTCQYCGRVNNPTKWDECDCRGCGAPLGVAYINEDVSIAKIPQGMVLYLDPTFSTCTTAHLTASQYREINKRD